MEFIHLENFVSEEFNNFNIQTIKIKSKYLRSDDSIKYNQVLVPKKVQDKLPLVIVLAGFSGNGSKYFNERFHEDNFPQTIDRLANNNMAPEALYLFVDAMNYWGGGQFINSKGMGNFEDYIVKELYSGICEHYEVDKNKVCIFGGSSGGYGGLHLASKFPELFPFVAAISPDSFFKMSLLPELYTALPVVEKYGSIKEIVKQINKGKFLKSKASFSTMNAIAMALCYSGEESTDSENLFPISNDGELNEAQWNKWLAHDPIYFLKDRLSAVKSLKAIYLEVGKYDQYNLQFGARLINKIIVKNNDNFKYNEFEGNHFDISGRREFAFKWLLEQWKI